MTEPGRSAGRPRLLVVQHETDCPPGWVGEWLTDAGCRLEVVHPYAARPGPPTTLPEHLAGYAGLLVLGGSASANDDGSVPWLGRTKDLIREAAATGVPTLGICLGHQLAAVALGGVVERNPAGPTIGVHPVGWRAAVGADPLFGPVARVPGDPGAGATAATPAVHWNDDIVTRAPAGTVTLADGPGGQLLAARFAPTVWGVQSHPEVDARTVATWAAWDRDSATERGVDVDGALSAIAAAEPTLRRVWSGLALGFAGQAASAVTIRRGADPLPEPG